ncbi:unnamed protein product, partial [Onchocerca ochengi]
HYHNNVNDDDDDDDIDGDNDDDDDEMWHDYQSVMRNKSPTIASQYDMPPSESERELYSHLEETDHHQKESDDHLIALTEQQSVQLANGSIGPLPNVTYDLNRRSSALQKQKTENNLDEAQSLFKYVDSRDDKQTKTLKVQFTVADDKKP